MHHVRRAFQLPTVVSWVHNAEIRVDPRKLTRWDWAVKKCSKPDASRHQARVISMQHRLSKRATRPGIHLFIINLSRMECNSFQFRMYERRKTCFPQELERCCGYVHLIAELIRIRSLRGHAFTIYVCCLLSDSTTMWFLSDWNGNEISIFWLPRLIATIEAILRWEHWEFLGYANAENFNVHALAQTSDYCEAHALMSRDHPFLYSILLIDLHEVYINIEHGCEVWWVLRAPQ